MHGPISSAGQLIALTLTLPFLILTMPVSLTRSGIRLAKEHKGAQRAAQDDETRLMQRIHDNMAQMVRRVESLKASLSSDSRCPTDYFGREGATFEPLNGATAECR